MSWFLTYERQTGESGGMILVFLWDTALRSTRAMPRRGWASPAGRSSRSSRRSRAGIGVHEAQGKAAEDGDEQIEDAGDPREALRCNQRGLHSTRSLLRGGCALGNRRRRRPLAGTHLRERRSQAEDATRVTDAPAFDKVAAPDMMLSKVSAVCAVRQARRSRQSAQIRRPRKGGSRRATDEASCNRLCSALE